MSDKLMAFEQRTVLGKEFRIYGDFENPLFLAKEVAEWIDYGKDKTGQMLSTIDNSEKLTATIYRSGQKREMWFLTEDGLYEVLMQSRKPIAREFKTKVKEILKQIRQTGGFVKTGREAEFISNYFPSFSEEVKLAMVLDLQKQNENYKLKIEEMKPLSDFGKHVSESYNTIDIGEFAKIVKNENLDIGRNRLFEFLRSKKILMSNNVPYQKYIENKWFEVIETVRETKFGTKVFSKTLISGKGQVGVLKFLKESI